MSDLYGQRETKIYEQFTELTKSVSTFDSLRRQAIEKTSNINKLSSTLEVFYGHRKSNDLEQGK
jgi:hypothetical protein